MYNMWKNLRTIFIFIENGFWYRGKVNLESDAHLASGIVWKISVYKRYSLKENLQFAMLPTVFSGNFQKTYIRMFTKLYKVIPRSKSVPSFFFNRHTLYFYILKLLRFSFKLLSFWNRTNVCEKWYYTTDVSSSSRTYSCCMFYLIFYIAIQNL